jgi:hypothetical protein
MLIFQIVPVVSQRHQASADESSPSDGLAALKWVHEKEGGAVRYPPEGRTGGRGENGSFLLTATVTVQGVDAPLLIKENVLSFG